ncbi:MAG: hypothetical protein AAGF01_12640 [Cyanobacteria bacterium P01_G01_bin.38]
MTESTKATRATVQIGLLEVDAFQLPDGSYRMSQTQAAEIIGRPEINARRFLGSKGIKILLGKGYTPDSIEVESTQGQRGGTRFNALPLEVVTAYWVSQCSQGNKQALALVMSLAIESLERRFDSAFGIQHTEAEYNQTLADRVWRLEGDLAQLGEAYAEPDVLRERVSRLEQQLLDAGIEPFGPPDSEDA